ncbi:MAG: pyridoxamine 5'-phosphate oxidase family protein [Desulfobacteraceae bacterium]|nr:pyridoxamine 5'-phosphate oxidase family protein [Desulfobacteraceae bacterium]
MRRKEKEITDRGEIERILNEALVCRLALSDDDGPYIVPLNFGYVRGRIYAHSANEGKKIDLIRKGGRVCFEVETDVEVVPNPSGVCKWTTKYRSVIGFGRARLAESAGEKREGLMSVLRHYGLENIEIPESGYARLAMIVIEIDSMTGKKSGFPKPE